MELHITFPKNLITEWLLQQEKIPCICLVSQEFEMRFQEPLPEARGLVRDWDRRSIDDRVPAVVGEPYTHYAFGLVSLEPSAPDCYHISELALFDGGCGWCPVIVDGVYGPLGSFWDVEEGRDVGPPNA
jgi:hypothetical protein